MSVLPLKLAFLDRDVQNIAVAVFWIFFALNESFTVETNLSEKRFGNRADSQLEMLIGISQILNGELSTHVAFKELLEIFKLRH